MIKRNSRREVLLSPTVEICQISGVTPSLQKCYLVNGRSPPYTRISCPESPTRSTRCHARLHILRAVLQLLPHATVKSDFVISSRSARLINFLSGIFNFMTTSSESWANRSEQSVTKLLRFRSLTAKQSFFLRETPRQAVDDADR